MNDKQLIFYSILSGILISILASLGDLAVGSQLTFCIILGNILWGIIFAYLVFEFIKRMKNKKEDYQ